MARLLWPAFYEKSPASGAFFWGAASSPSLGAALERWGLARSAFTDKDFHAAIAPAPVGRVIAGDWLA